MITLKVSVSSVEKKTLKISSSLHTNTQINKTDKNLIAFTFHSHTLGYRYRSRPDNENPLPDLLKGGTRSDFFPL